MLPNGAVLHGRLFDRMKSNGQASARRAAAARVLWIRGGLVLMAGAWNAARWRLLVPAQAGTRVKELAAGKILVARRELLDPHFAETVVLLVQYDEKRHSRADHQPEDEGSNLQAFERAGTRERPHGSVVPWRSGRD